MQEDTLRMIPDQVDTTGVRWRHSLAYNISRLMFFGRPKTEQEREQERKRRLEAIGQMTLQELEQELDLFRIIDFEYANAIMARRRELEKRMRLEAFDQMTLRELEQELKQIRRERVYGDLWFSRRNVFEEEQDIERLISQRINCIASLYEGPETPQDKFFTPVTEGIVSVSGSGQFNLIQLQQQGHRRKQPPLLPPHAAPISPDLNPPGYDFEGQRQGQPPLLPPNAAPISPDLNTTGYDFEGQRQQQQQHHHNQPDPVSPPWQSSMTSQKQPPLQQFPPVLSNLGRGPFSIGCLILLICFSAVSGLCSTCLEERCHDNGECIIGCVPGYVGSYCELQCPARCLNNECDIDRIRGTVTCTNGCEPGYYGVKCSYKCPDGCVTCDRQGGSCNITLCPEGRYTANCRKAVQCSLRYEKCDRETGECIRCRRGYFGDECTRECRACFTRAEHITDGCLSGCEKCKTEEACGPGFYGQICEHRCSGGCQPSDDDTRHPCNRATGECSAGCVSGYHGLTCNYTCSEHCVSGRCNRATGECSAGCVSGYHGLNCNYTCNRFCVSGICNQHNGVCTFGCISRYVQKFDVCEKMHETEVNMEASSSAIHVTIAVLACLLVFLTSVFCFRYLSVIRTQISERKKAAKNEQAQNMNENRRFLNDKTRQYKF